MNALVKMYQSKQSDSPVVASLQSVLANTYGVYLASHNYHWNVEGENFLALHAMFDDQYNSLIKAVDTIAERIRALGDYALPFEGDEIIKTLQMTSNPLNKDTDANDRADRMVRNLAALNETAVKSCNEAKVIARREKDEETENLMVERVTAHQKTLWILNSILK